MSEQFVCFDTGLFVARGLSTFTDGITRVFAINQLIASFILPNSASISAFSLNTQ